MATPMQPLRDEHRELLPQVEELRELADAVGNMRMEELARRVDDVHTFLTRRLLPHAQAEEYALYPVVGGVLGSTRATATMSRDHVEVGRLTHELGSLRSLLFGAFLSDELAKALRQVLYGLYALIKVHFAKEEEIYLPMLDAALTPEAAHRMFASMEVAAQEAKYYLPVG